jgi:hypothetical protein
VKLNKLTLKDSNLFNKFLKLQRHELSVYSFENTYIWKWLFDIEWLAIKENLCVFFRDRGGSFLYLAPLGNNKDAKLPAEAFDIMDRVNKNREISRIENIEEKDLGFYKGLGYDCCIKSHDYVFARRDLVNLKGNRFKSKRASCNYFIKHYDYEFLPFSIRHKNDCLSLYNRWQEGRKCNNPDPVYRAMLNDNLSSLKLLLNNYRDLNVAGRIVRIGKQIKAFTFGFKLNSDTFCILFEITDLSVRGLAQFIFRAFSGELKGYRYINAMDDSGLNNLKKVKLSYHPVRLVPAYIAKRKI